MGVGVKWYEWWLIGQVARGIDPPNQNPADTPGYCHYSRYDSHGCQWSRHLPAELKESLMRHSIW